MLDRGFNEVDLRLMLEEAEGYHPDVVPGRWVVETRHAVSEWEVIVQPVPEEADPRDRDLVPGHLMP